VRRQHTANKQNAVDQAIRTKVVEESHGQRREEYVEDRYAASVAECRKHSCCLLVLMVAVRIHPVFCICDIALVPGVQSLEVQVRVSNYVRNRFASRKARQQTKARTVITTHTC
jgi:hypothetical protein